MAKLAELLATVFPAYAGVIQKRKRDSLGKYFRNALVRVTGNGIHAVLKTLPAHSLLADI